jgi:hypothetical protein
MTHVKLDHVPSFLKAKHGKSFVVATKANREGTEYWRNCNTYVHAEDMATPEETLVYLECHSERALRGLFVPQSVPCHDVEAWEDFNDMSLAA